MTIDLDVLEEAMKMADPGLVAGPSAAVIQGILTAGISQQRPVARVPTHPEADAKYLSALTKSAPDLIAAARERDGLREALTTIAEGPVDDGFFLKTVARQALQAGEKG